MEYVVHGIDMNELDAEAERQREVHRRRLAERQQAAPPPASAVRADDGDEDAVTVKARELLAARGTTLEAADYETLAEALAEAAEQVGYHRSQSDKPAPPRVSETELVAETDRILAAEGKDATDETAYVAALERAEAKLVARGRS